MNQYDPLKAPNPEEWLALDEDERMDLVLQYHRRARVKPPNERLHAVFHTVIETQVAMGDDIPVRQTLERLQKEGLDRHDGIHAVASVLANHFHEILSRGSPANEDPHGDYFQELEKLTAKGWLSEWDTPES